MTHDEADPMRREPPAMLPSLPDDRVQQLTYSYDWLANMTEWRDDAESFYERSIGDVVNGNSAAQSGQGLRPSALYLATNVPESAPVDDPGTTGVNEGPNPAIDRGGWVDVTYGEGGNVEAFTVRAQCHDASTSDACYLERDNATGQPTGTLAQQRWKLESDCVCESAQHYQYRWDELNRLAEARRYDQTVAGETPHWELKVRQRYRYDAGNVRIVKQTLDPTPAAEFPERVHLYVIPGDFERSGLTVDRSVLGDSTYAASTALGTETQYMIAGARIVWKPGDVTSPFDREHRITYAFTDLIRSTSAVVDLANGELLELTTFYPNGARETHRTTHEESYQLELNGFTGKEEDEEVGVTYFGERYLIPRLGRWASPDPLAIHEARGGEALNAYQYVGGNLLAARDPIGLDKVAVSVSRADFELAQLCRSSYDQSNVEGYRRASDEDQREHGLDEFFDETGVATGTDGFSATLFVNESTGAFVLAFRGTEGGDPGTTDWLQNFAQGLWGTSSQYMQAMILADRVSRVASNGLVLTGHSLGGGLARAASQATRRRSVTFNAAGLHPFTMREANWRYERRYTSLERARRRPSWSGDPESRAYSLYGDLLSALQQSAPIPDTDRNERIIIRAPHLTSAGDSLQRHFIDTVIEAMRPLVGETTRTVEEWSLLSNPSGPTRATD